jgi:hypothetical protein
MKTLKTLLALSLLVSSFAPVCAMEGQEAQAPEAVETVPTRLDAAQAGLAAAQAALAAAAEDAPNRADLIAATVAAQAEVTAATPVPSFADRAKAFVGDKAAAVKGFYAWNPEAKATSIAKYGVTAAAVAAVIGGSYALYNYLFADEESDEEEVVTEEAPVAPVEAPVKTTPAPVAPVAAKPASNNGGPRRGRHCKKHRSSKKTSSARVKRASKKSCCK